MIIKIYGNGCIKCKTIQMWTSQGIVSKETGEYIHLDQQETIEFQEKHPIVQSFPVGITVIDGVEKYLDFNECMDIFKQNKVDVDKRVKLI